MNTLLTLLMLFSVSQAFANKEQFCADRTQPKFVKELTLDASNLMSFKNHGGILNGGVCWWHSRFQRAALYLTHYNPSAPKPDQATARQIIRTLRNANDVVEISGFNNFLEFSTQFEKEIQTELEAWQRFESLRFTWIRGLRGSIRVSAEWMQELMDNLFEETEVSGNISFQKLQMKGLTAHAWLVVNMKKFDNGYDLEVIDSNYQNMTKFYQYRRGDTHLLYKEKSPFTPYLEHTFEMERINSAIKEACQS
jgi:hypothetical protein